MARDNVFILENVISVSGKPTLVAKKFLLLENLFSEPLPSGDLDIYICSKLSKDLTCIPADSMQAKGVLLSWKGKHVFFPLLNSFPSGT